MRNLLDWLRKVLFYFYYEDYNMVPLFVLPDPNCPFLTCFDRISYSQLANHKNKDIEPWGLKNHKQKANCGPIFPFFFLSDSPTTHNHNPLHLCFSHHFNFCMPAQNPFSFSFFFSSNPYPEIKFFSFPFFFWLIEKEGKKRKNN